MNSSIASANNATLATVATTYALKSVVDQLALDVAARQTAADVDQRVATALLSYLTQTAYQAAFVFTRSGLRKLHPFLFSWLNMILFSLRAPLFAEQLLTFAQLLMIAECRSLSAARAQSFLLSTAITAALGTLNSSNRRSL